jgi:hypothetical protein
MFFSRDIVEHVDHHRDVIVLVEAHVGAVSVKLDSSVE